MMGVCYENQSISKVAISFLNCILYHDSLICQVLQERSVSCRSWQDAV